MKKWCKWRRSKWRRIGRTSWRRHVNEENEEINEEEKKNKLKKTCKCKWRRSKWRSWGRTYWRRDVNKEDEKEVNEEGEVNEEEEEEITQKRTIWYWYRGQSVSILCVRFTIMTVGRNEMQTWFDNYAN